MTDTSAGSAAGSPSPVLSAAETRAAESLLAQALGKQVAVSSAERFLDRSHIVRLRMADCDGSAILKRRRPEDFGGRVRGFGAELAALAFLNDEETAIAPRLLGASADMLLMEDLGPGSSLAHTLLAGDRDRAEADIIGYARALGSMHSWSIGRTSEFEALWARHAAPAPVQPELLQRVTEGTEPFLAVAARLGLPLQGVADEIGSLPALLRDSGHSGLVHGDPCPDNTHIADGKWRIFDFETAGWGPIALDVVYLLAPFPSCWCFAALPASAAEPALRAYRDQLTQAGIYLGASWDAALTAAQAAWVVVRGAGIGRALDADRDWGTTTVRPRLLAWLRSFIDAEAATGVLPRLRSLTEALHAELADRWPSTVIPSYPALAPPGAPLAGVPDWWESGG
ncbi:MAG TPA: aminoglycoside phosphotransferase family protein [Trebonia sp.]|jgi:hypothetical protein